MYSHAWAVEVSYHHGKIMMEHISLKEDSTRVKLIAPLLRKEVMENPLNCWKILKTTHHNRTRNGRWKGARAEKRSSMYKKL